MLITYGRDSVLFWRRCDMLCKSGFMDNLQIMGRMRYIDQYCCSDRVTSLRRRVQVIAPLLRRIGCVVS